MNPEFWKGKSVFLTGHTGFKGSWLSLVLQKLGVKLVGFSKSIPTKPSLFELAKVEEGMISIFGDVRDQKFLEKTIREHKPEIIIHMAAQAILRNSYKDPVETYGTNVMGTVNLLESVRKVSGTKAVLNITSDKCYENTGSSNSYKEEDSMGGFDPYSNSKGCAELVTSSYRNSFFNSSEFEKHGIALASARAGNVIGGGDWGQDRLIPDIIRGIIDRTKIKIRYPNAIRPWQYIMDPINGYLMLIEKLWSKGDSFNEGWNFGPSNNDNKSVKWIVEKLSKQWEREINWDLDDAQNPHEENYLSLDCSKARTKLDWMPKIDLEKALSWTTDWYKNYEQNNDMRQFTEQQIMNFNSL